MSSKPARFGDGVMTERVRYATHKRPPPFVMRCMRGGGGVGRRATLTPDPRRGTKIERKNQNQSTRYVLAFGALSDVCRAC